MPKIISTEFIHGLCSGTSPLRTTQQQPQLGCACTTWTSATPTSASSGMFTFFSVAFVFQTLSACSSFFRNVLRQNPHQHPSIYLGGVREQQMKHLLQLIYFGKATLHHANLEKFLKVIEDFGGGDKAPIWTTRWLVLLMMITGSNCQNPNSTTTQLNLT